MKTASRSIAALALILVSSMAAAQQYPSREIHVISAVAAGSGADILVRFFAEKLRPLTGQSVVVENKVGAGGNIAAEYTAKARPDGHTMLIYSVSVIAANYSLLKNPPVNPSRDLQVVAATHQQPFMIVVPPNSPHRTLGELTAAMKTKGDKASYGHSNTTGKVIGELYKAATGVSAVDVPYRQAGDSLNDYASNRLDFGVMDPVTAISQSQAGKIRMLAASTSRRLAAAPDLPTLKEGGVPVELVLWLGVMVPTGTPKPIADQMNRWFAEVVAMEETKKFLAGFGSDPWTISPEQAQAQFVKDQADWANFVRIARIEPQ